MRKLLDRNKPTQVRLYSILSVYKKVYRVFVGLVETNGSNIRPAKILQRSFKDIFKKYKDKMVGIRRHLFPALTCPPAVAGSAAGAGGCCCCRGTSSSPAARPPRPGGTGAAPRRSSPAGARRFEKIFVDVKNIWTDHAADDAKHDGSQSQEHKLRVGPALNIKF